MFLKRRGNAVALTVLVTFCLEIAVQRSAASSANEITNPEVIRRYQHLITSESLAARLYFFASDFFEGRETTTRGQRLAAHYLVSQYRQMGLTPKGTGTANDPLSASPYFQSFDLYRRTPKQSHLDVEIDGKRVAESNFSARTQDDLSFFDDGGFEATSGNAVFAGYGIADDQLGYDDFAALANKGLSISDKWVIILADEPLRDDKTSLLPTPNHAPSAWSTQFVRKRAALWKAGRPKGVLIISDVSPRVTDSFSDRAKQVSLKANAVGPLSLVPSSDFPPIFAVSSKLANQLLGPDGFKVADLKQKIDSSLKPVVFALSDRVTVNAQVEPNPSLKSENVLAFIEGVDPKLKDEVIIISAHYDHLGVNPSLKGDQIFNGAADDGSGVVACLEMAQWFMKAKRDGVGPRRSILFINFSGEEKGTLGSNYYSLNPVIPWDRTVAEINMDGVGGFDVKHPSHSKNYIYVIGREDLSKELVENTKQLNSQSGTNLELTEGKRFNSDNLNFESQMIPYLYYSTGLTEQYHQVGDEPDTIDYKHLARVVQLIFATAWDTINRDVRPKSVDRSQLTLVGYICPPCGFSCDEAVHSQYGECPVCDMALRPKYELKSGANGYR